MHKPISRSRRGLLFTVFALVTLPSWSAGERKVPDLLDSAAKANVRANQSNLLAVTTAGKRLVAVGVQGIVLLSDDQGKTWRQAKAVPVSVALTSVYFANERLGWAVGHGGVILHSQDAGETWQKQLDGRDAGQLILAEAKELSSAEAQSRAVRNGERWLQDGPDKPLLDVLFVTPERGWVVGAYGFILTTEDGGRTWRSIMERLPNKGGKHIYNVRVFGDQIVLAGEQGSLFKSKSPDGQFERINTPYAGTYFGSLATKAGTQMVFGLRGNIWRQASGSSNWEKIDYANPVSIAAGVQLTDGRLVLGDQSGQLSVSTNDGASFSMLNIPAVPGLTALVQASDSALVATGAQGARRIEVEQIKAEEKK